MRSEVQLGEGCWGRGTPHLIPASGRAPAAPQCHCPPLLSIMLLVVHSKGYVHGGRTRCRDQGLHQQPNSVIARGRAAARPTAIGAARAAWDRKGEARRQLRRLLPQPAASVPRGGARAAAVAGHASVGGFLLECQQGDASSRWRCLRTE